MKINIRATAAAGIVLLVGCQSGLSKLSADRGLVSTAENDRSPARRNRSRGDGHNPPDVGSDLFAESDRAPSNRRPLRPRSGPNSGDSSDALLAKAHAAAAAKRFDDAKRLYRQVRVDDADYSIAQHRLAVIADQERDFSVAENHYLTALRSGSSDPDLLSDLGYSYLLQNRFEESEQYFQAALKREPAHRRALNNLGLLYGRRGDYDLALAAFRKAGTEAEAQAKIARLFPSGRRSDGVLDAPVPQAPSHLAGRPSLTPTSLAADRGRNSRSGAFGDQFGNETMEAARAPNETTQQLKQLMDEAGRRSQVERAQRAAETNAQMIRPAGWNTPSAYPQPSYAPQQVAGGWGRPSTPSGRGLSNAPPIDNPYHAAFDSIDRAMPHRGERGSQRDLRTAAFSNSYAANPSLETREPHDEPGRYRRSAPPVARNAAQPINSAEYAQPDPRSYGAMAPAPRPIQPGGAAVNNNRPDPWTNRGSFNNTTYRYPAAAANGFHADGRRMIPYSQYSSQNGGNPSSDGVRAAQMLGMGAGGPLPMLPPGNASGSDVASGPATLPPPAGNSGLAEPSGGFYDRRDFTQPSAQPQPSGGASANGSGANGPAHPANPRYSGSWNAAPAASSAMWRSPGGGNYLQGPPPSSAALHSPVMQTDAFRTGR